MPTLELFDLQGAFWRLAFGACQLNKRDGLWYALWFVDEDCPAFLFTNGCHYEFIPTPIFTEWWS